MDIWKKVWKWVFFNIINCNFSIKFYLYLVYGDKILPQVLLNFIESIIKMMRPFRSMIDIKFKSMYVIFDWNCLKIPLKLKRPLIKHLIVHNQRSILLSNLTLFRTLTIIVLKFVFISFVQAAPTIRNWIDIESTKAGVGFWDRNKRCKPLASYRKRAAIGWEWPRGRGQPITAHLR